jgi:plasmid stabilization system protein ParE
LRNKLIAIPHIALVKSLHRIANGTFDPKMRLNPDAMAQEVAASLPSLNETSERRALGLQLSSGRRDIYVAEQSPGALDAAKIDKGTIGELVRDLSRTGFLTKNPNKLDDVLRDTRADENSSARAYLRRVRKNKATIQEEAAITRATQRLHRLRELVDAGEAIIARDIRHTLDCRDIAVNWPMEWTRGMPVPIASAHDRVGTGWVAMNYQEDATQRYIGAAEVNPVSAFDYGAVGSRIRPRVHEHDGAGASE